MQQLLISVLSDLNNTSPYITASAVISTDGLPKKSACRDQHNVKPIPITLVKTDVEIIPT